MKIWLLAALFGGIWLLFSVAAPWIYPVDKVVFLDIGQGDSIFFQHGTQQVLVDGGSGGLVLSRLAEEMPWFDRTVDVVVATHPDKDHMGGILDVVKRYKVGLVLLSDTPHTTQLQESWLSVLQEKLKDTDTVVQFAWRGDRLAVGNMSFEVLSPWPELVTQLHGTTNNGSIVMRVDVGHTSFLLTGDAEMAVERALIAKDTRHHLDVDVLKVGHHGSKTSTSPELLNATTPSLAAISVGLNNSYGLPTEQVLNLLRSIPIVRTDKAGSIRLVQAQPTWLLSCRQKPCISNE